jgi:hypothetical protein
MTWGMFKTLMQTGFYEVLSQFNQPTTFFGVVTGTSFIGRIHNFVDINRNNYFMMMWVVAQFSLVVSRLVQLYGVFVGVRAAETRGAAILLMITIIYFLLITGPISSPRYRIPAEPPLIILFALGLAGAVDFVRNKYTAGAHSISNEAA